LCSPGGLGRHRCQWMQGTPEPVVPLVRITLMGRQWPQNLHPLVTESRIPMHVGRSLARIAAALLLAGPLAAQGFTLNLQPTGNTTRFIVRETFVNVPTPFDATGTTEKVTGQIVFDAQGKIVPASSKITVDLTSLATDNENRDRQF